MGLCRPSVVPWPEGYGSICSVACTEGLWLPKLRAGKAKATNSSCPLAQGTHLPETISEMSVDGSPWFGYVSPLEAASGQGGSAQRNRARGKPSFLCFTPLETSARKTEAAVGAHLSLL